MRTFWVLVCAAMLSGCAAPSSATPTTYPTFSPMPTDGTYQVSPADYGVYESAAFGQTPCIWIRHNSDYVEGRIATGIIERGQADPGQTARVTLSREDSYFTTMNCKAWKKVTW